jgi:hypothetical protein
MILRISDEVENKRKNIGYKVVAIKDSGFSLSMN